MSIGNNIKKLRELRNFTQVHMSEKLDMSIAGYSKIERDETDLSVSRLEEIAKILETDMISILQLDPSKIFNINQQHGTSDIQSGYVGLQKNFDKQAIAMLVDQLKKENEFLKELLKSKTV